VFNPKAGATVIGAREFLIAYNINLNTRDRKLAHEIALSLRESGRAKKDKSGNPVLDAEGQQVKLPGRFPHVKSVGWYIEDYGIAQVSINFTNYKVTPVHVVFDEARKEADKLGLRVTGSELVGLIPKEAVLISGRYYLEKQGKSAGVPEEELIRTAVLSLGLNDVAPFDPQKKIIEFQFEPSSPSLTQLTVRGFANELSMDSPAPGGGSAAALCGALSAALSSMVANLTVGKKGYEAVAEEMKSSAVEAQELKDALLRAVNDDTALFNRLMEAFRLPKKTEDQARERDQAVEEAAKAATIVPLEVMRKSISCLKLARQTALKGNQNSLSDAGVAGLTAQTCAEGAYFNVRINLPGIKDKDFKTATLNEALSLRDEALALGQEIRQILDKGLKG
jgi:glutamate formiminotransferase/formiminotetrahydrofolate cyclodeaminase